MKTWRLLATRLERVPYPDGQRAVAVCPLTRGWRLADACHAARMSSGAASGSTPSTSYHVIPLISGHR